METPVPVVASWDPAAAPASVPGRFGNGGAFIVGRHIYCSQAGGTRSNCRCREFSVGDFVFLFCRRLVYIFYAMLCVTVGEILMSMVDR